MIIINGMMSCYYTQRAIKLCEDENLEYKYNEIPSDELPDLKKKWNHTTIPIIILDGKKIGGFTELEQKFQRNEL